MYTGNVFDISICAYQLLFKMLSLLDTDRG